mmetsp:Transcript_32089/g.83197  ORF Transcript_32089/g.83197 Transcript_32089/m.83197 type:complete len:276 (+) Transcript_32089:1-828(+)
MGFIWRCGLPAILLAEHRSIDPEAGELLSPDELDVLHVNALDLDSIGSDHTTSAHFMAQLRNMVDKDRNGKVSPDELLQHCLARDKRLLLDMPNDSNDFDTDGDAHVSWDELLTSLQPLEAEDQEPRLRSHFLSSDMDEDGRLNQTEVTRFFFEHASSQGDSAADAAISDLDRNGDAQLDTDEYLAGSQHHGESSREEFGKLDSDKDGFLSAGEYGALATGAHIVQDILSTFVQALDSDRDGIISISEAGENFDKVKDHEAMLMWFDAAGQDQEL